MEGYTTNNMFQSQDAMLENVEQKNEISVEQQPVTQQAPQQHDQEQEHPGWIPRSSSSSSSLPSKA